MFYLLDQITQDISPLLTPSTASNKTRKRSYTQTYDELPRLFIPNSNKCYGASDRVLRKRKKLVLNMFICYVYKPLS